MKQTSSLSFWGRLAAPSIMILPISSLSSLVRELIMLGEKTCLAFVPQAEVKACSSRDACT